MYIPKNKETANFWSENYKKCIQRNTMYKTCTKMCTIPPPCTRGAQPTCSMLLYILRSLWEPSHDVPFTTHPPPVSSPPLLTSLLLSLTPTITLKVTPAQQGTYMHDVGKCGRAGWVSEQIEGVKLAVGGVNEEIVNFGHKWTKREYMCP